MSNQEKDGYYYLFEKAHQLFKDIIPDDILAKATADLVSSLKCFVTDRHFYAPLLINEFTHSACQTVTLGRSAHYDEFERIGLDIVIAKYPLETPYTPVYGDLKEIGIESYTRGVSEGSVARIYKRTNDKGDEFESIFNVKLIFFNGHAHRNLFSAFIHHPDFCVVNFRKMTNDHPLKQRMIRVHRDYLTTAFTDKTLLDYDVKIAITYVDLLTGSKAKRTKIYYNNIRLGNYRKALETLMSDLDAKDISLLDVDINNLLQAV